MRCSWCNDQPETPECSMCVVPLGNAVCRTWREIASVGAYVLAHERFQRLNRMLAHAIDYCGCEQDKACPYHEMWQAGEGPWR